MPSVLLMKLEDHNCWTIAEAARSGITDHIYCLAPDTKRVRINRTRH
jgi:hypothetical protein